MSTNSNQPAFNYQALASALTEATGETIDAYHLPINQLGGIAAEKLVITLASLRFTAFEKRWQFIDHSAALTEIEAIPANWVLSPAGDRAAFLRDGNIWIRELASGEERALTTDAEPFYPYGVPGAVWGNDAFLEVLPLQARWSPDGRQLFTVQLDQRQVKTVAETQHVPLDGSLRPKTRQRKLAFRGRAY